MHHYINYFRELIYSDSIFWFCALAGSGMFFIQLILNMFGFLEQDSLDAGSDAVFDGTGEANNHSSDARNFKWLSMHTITSFLMMFGWTAITCQTEFNLPNMATLGISLAVGVIAAIIVRSIFKAAKRLHSSGTTYKIDEAIGKEAYVYHRIPKGGTGKISIALQHFTHEIDAISHHSEELSSFTRVKIIEKKDDNTVVVALL